MLRRLELARQLRGEITAGIDFLHLGRLGRDGAIQRLPRRARGVPQRGDLDLPGLECCARRLQVGHRLTMVLELFSIASSQRPDQPVVPADRAEIADTQQEPRIPRRPHLVERDQTGFDQGTLRIGLAFEAGHPCRHVLELAGRFGKVAVDHGELLRLDLPVDIEPSDFLEQGAFA